MKLWGLLFFLIGLAGGGWWLYDVGYDAGVASSTRRVVDLQSQVTQLETAAADRLAQAKKDADKRKKEVAKEKKDFARRQKTVKDDLATWMAKYNSAVNSCAIAKQSLCPSLLDY